jgi:hypothetical protein
MVKAQIGDALRFGDLPYCFEFSTAAFDKVDQRLWMDNRSDGTWKTASGAHIEPDGARAAGPRLLQVQAEGKTVQKMPADALVEVPDRGQVDALTGRKDSAEIGQQSISLAGVEIPTEGAGRFGECDCLIGKPHGGGGSC